MRGEGGVMCSNYGCDLTVYLFEGDRGLGATSALAKQGICHRHRALSSCDGGEGFTYMPEHPIPDAIHYLL